MSPDMRFPTMWYVRPAKAQTSLRICGDWSEPLLVYIFFYLSYWTSFGASKLKRRLQRLVGVHTCQNATLMEITRCSSYDNSSHLCTSVYWCLVVTCWEMADLLALVCDVELWSCHFHICILRQVWCLIVSIPDLCPLSYLKIMKSEKTWPPWGVASFPYAHTHVGNFNISWNQWSCRSENN